MSGLRKNNYNKTKSVANDHKKFQAYRACKLPLDITNLFSGSVWHHFGPIFVAHKLKMRKTCLCTVPDTEFNKRLLPFLLLTIQKIQSGSYIIQTVQPPNDCQEKTFVSSFPIVMPHINEWLVCALYCQRWH